MIRHVYMYINIHMKYASILWLSCFLTTGRSENHLLDIWRLYKIASQTTNKGNPTTIGWFTFNGVYFFLLSHIHLIYIYISKFMLYLYLNAAAFVDFLDFTSTGVNKVAAGMKTYATCFSLFFFGIFGNST